MAGQVSADGWGGTVNFLLTSSQGIVVRRQYYWVSSRGKSRFGGGNNGCVAGVGVLRMTWRGVRRGCWAGIVICGRLASCAAC